jgi:hypothetical protein
MAAELAAEVKAVRAMLQSMADKPGVQAVMTAQVDRLMVLVQKASVSVHDCPALISEVSQCGFSQRDSDRLLGAIAQRTGQSAGGNKAKLQDFTSLAHYFMQAQWDTLQQGSSGNPLHIILGQGGKLGLRYPSEPTWQLLTALYILVQNSPTAAQAMSAASKNEVLKHVKRSGRRLLQAGVVEISRLSDSPAEFRILRPAKYEDIFSSAQSVPHPFGLGCGMFAESIKMRITSSLSPSLPSSSLSNQMQQNMCTQFMQMMMGQLMGQMQPAPQLSIFGGRQAGSSERPALLPAKQGPRALPPTPSPPGRMVVMEEDKEEVKVEKEPNSGKEPTVSLLAPNLEKGHKRVNVHEASEQVRRVLQRRGDEEKAAEDDEAPMPTMKRPAAASTKGPASIGMEHGRKQVRCRRGDGSSFAIPWGKRKGVWTRSREEAAAEAQAWLQEQS